MGCANSRPIPSPLYGLVKSWISYLKKKRAVLLKHMADWRAAWSMLVWPGPAVKLTPRGPVHGSASAQLKKRRRCSKGTCFGHLSVYLAAFFSPSDFKTCA